MQSQLIEIIAEKLLVNEFRKCLASSTTDKVKSKEKLLQGFMEHSESERESLLRRNLYAIVNEYPSQLIHSIWWSSERGIADITSRLDLIYECDLSVRQIGDFLPDEDFDIKVVVSQILANTMMLKIEEKYLQVVQRETGYCHIDQEELKTTFDSLINLTSAYKGSARFLKFLQFTTKIKNYSAFNVALVHAQNPSAEYVATSTDWERRHNRKVKSDASPIIILAPFHPVLMVFDVKDTVGEPLPNRCYSAFWAEGYQPIKEIEYLIGYLAEAGVQVDYQNLKTTQAGSITRYADKQAGYTLVVNKSHDVATQFATIIHELGHWLCGHLGKSKGIPDRRALNLDEKEFEAESVSFIVCKRFGIRSNAEEYLSGYSCHHSLIPPKASIDLILKSASKIETIIKSNSKDAGVMKEKNEAKLVPVQSGFIFES